MTKIPGGAAGPQRAQGAPQDSPKADKAKADVQAKHGHKHEGGVRDVVLRPAGGANTVVPNRFEAPRGVNIGGKAAVPEHTAPNTPMGNRATVQPQDTGFKDQLAKMQGGIQLGGKFETPDEAVVNRPGGAEVKQAGTPEEQAAKAVRADQAADTEFKEQLAAGQREEIGGKSVDPSEAKITRRFVPTKVMSAADAEIARTNHSHAKKGVFRALINLIKSLGNSEKRAEARKKYSEARTHLRQSSKTVLENKGTNISMQHVFNDDVNGPNSEFFRDAYTDITGDKYLEDLENNPPSEEAVRTAYKDLFNEEMPEA